MKLRREARMEDVGRRRMMTCAKVFKYVPHVVYKVNQPWCMIRFARFGTSAAHKIRRDLSRNPSRHIAEDGRVSLKAHLFGPRDKTLLDLSPLQRTEGRSARLRALFGVGGIGLLGSGLVYTAIMHPEVQLNKEERGKVLRDNEKKARRFASHRKLSSHNN